MRCSILSLSVLLALGLAACKNDVNLSQFAQQLDQWAPDVRDMAIDWADTQVEPEDKEHFAAVVCSSLAAIQELKIQAATGQADTIDLSRQVGSHLAELDKGFEGKSKKIKLAVRAVQRRLARLQPGGDPVSVSRFDYSKGGDFYIRLRGLRDK